MLEALGIHVDPAEIEAFFVKLRQDIPAAAQYVEREFRSVGERLDRIEKLLQGLAGGGVEAGQLLSGTELTLFDSGEITHDEMRQILIRRFTAQRRQKGATNGATDYIRITD
jgi:hypothetical protein